MKHILYIILLTAVCYTSSAQTFSLKDTSFVKGSVLRKNILFGCDAFIILSESRLFLDSMASFLNTNKQLQIEIGDHTDERGSAAYSKNLTGKRAQAIVDYLISKGVDKNRFLFKGYGNSNPVIVHAKKEEEHQINRRTEFKIISIEY